MKNFFLLCGLGLTLSATAQYENDNVRFHTVYLQDLDQSLRDHPDALLLDVRSSGEFCDTSQFPTLNIGHLDGAKNIPVQDLGKRLSEISAYKNQPVYVYCSHSQRSRRASKMLADSGFTNVINVNGGLSQYRRSSAETNFSALDARVKTNSTYTIIAPQALCERMDRKDVIWLDVRPDSSYNHKTSSALTNAYGRIPNAQHIAPEKLEKQAARLPKDKTILLIDDYGRGESAAAAVLAKQGFTKIELVFNGFDGLMTYGTTHCPCLYTFWQSSGAGKLINAEAVDSSMLDHYFTRIVDVRTKEEYDNKSSDRWKNTGRIKKAINIPAAEIEKRAAEISYDKNSPVLLYGFSGDDEPFAAAKKLTALGFTNVTVLTDGIFGVRWTAANIKGKTYLRDWVENLPALVAQ